MRTLLLFAMMLAASCHFIRREYVEYVPIERIIVRGDHRLTENVSIRSASHLREIVRILDQYGERYEVDESGRVWIPKQLADDLDLMANYTKKAQELRTNPDDPWNS